MCLFCRSDDRPAPPGRPESRKPPRRGGSRSLPRFANLRPMREDQVESLLEQRAAAIASLPSGPDSELALVQSWLLREDPEGARMGEVLRDSLDRIYDGARTGH